MVLEPNNWYTKTLESPSPSYSCLWEFKHSDLQKALKHFPHCYCCWSHPFGKDELTYVNVLFAYLFADSLFKPDSSALSSLRIEAFHNAHWQSESPPPTVFQLSLYGLPYCTYHTIRGTCCLSVDLVLVRFVLPRQSAVPST